MYRYLVLVPSILFPIHLVVLGTSEQDVFDRLRAAGSFAMAIVKIGADPSDEYTI